MKPGPVTGLAMTLTKPADNFTVAATWNAATNATTYAVALTNALTGTALAGSSVGVTSWSASVNLAGVTQVRLTVTPMNQRPARRRRSRRTCRTSVPPSAPTRSRGSTAPAPSPRPR